MNEEGRAGKGGRAGLLAVAQRAGVGIATVDRVLNERGSVSPAMARRVIEAARELDLRRRLPRPHTRQLRLESILARPDTPFLERLAQGFVSVAATLDRSATIHRTSLRQAAPAQIAQRLLASQADGIILYAEDHPEIAAAIATVTVSGRALVTMVTDIPSSGRIAYVGIDNAKAGRTAGFLVARLVRRPGPVIVVTNSLSYQAHAERIDGFREGLAREAPSMRIAAMLQGRDEDDVSDRMVCAALAEHPEAVAVYNSGGAVGAVGAAIARVRPPGNLVYVGHELTAESVTLLRRGVMTVAIDQAFELQARRAVEALLYRLGELEVPSGPADVPFTLHTRENV